VALPGREARAVARIECALARSDPALAAMTDIFSRLTQGQEMPPWERARPRRGRRIAALLLPLVLAAVLIASISMGIRGPSVAWSSFQVAYFGGYIRLPAVSIRPAGVPSSLRRGLPAPGCRARLPGLPCRAGQRCSERQTHDANIAACN
jgi:hypothetical protein